MNEEIKNENENIIVDEKTDKFGWIKAHAMKLGIGALIAVAGALGIWALVRQTGEPVFEDEMEGVDELIVAEMPEPEVIENEK